MKIPFLLFQYCQSSTKPNYLSSSAKDTNFINPIFLKKTATISFVYGCPLLTKAIKKLAFFYSPKHYYSKKIGYLYKRMIEGNRWYIYSSRRGTPTLKNHTMQEKFHKSKVVSKEKLRQLMSRKDNPAILRFVLTFTLFILAGVGLVMSWGGTWMGIILTHLVFGLLCCSMFAALHEAGHGTAFKSKKLNRIVAVLAGIAHLYPSHIFRELHFAHHRYTHIPGKDPEISIGDQPAPAIFTNPPLYLAFLTGIPYLYLKINLILLGVVGFPEIIRKKFTAYIRPKMRNKIAVECFFVALIYGSLIYLAIYVNAGFWGIFTGQIVGHGTLSMYLVMEHNGLPHEGDILERTRSIQTNKLVNFFLWNMPYHAEHHAYPAVPFHALPLLHEEMKGELKHKEKGLAALHLKAVQGFGK